MFKKTPETMRLTLRALARLLAYPGAGLRAQMPALIDALQTEQALPAARIAELQALAQQICAMDAYEAEGRYVDTFEEEEEIDLLAVRAEREQLKAQLNGLETEMAKYLEELGYGA